jgi:hypothetical protein
MKSSSRMFMWMLTFFFLILFAAHTSVFAGSITGGDAPDQASADAVLDIFFAIDTSGSMGDEASTIGNLTNNVVTNLDCPDTDVWVRARFFGIDGTWGGTLFDEDMVPYVTANGAAPPVTNQSEDNGPAVQDLVMFNDLVDDTTASQNYAKAVVSIGDEGTENGAPVAQDDYDAAFAANQAAIANGFFVFSILGNFPSAGAEDVFRLMAEGGSGGGYTFSDTGGTFTTSETASTEQDIEDIICTAVAPPTPAETTPIPTMNEWGMIIFMVIAGIGAAYYLRRRKTAS